MAWLRSVALHSPVAIGGVGGSGTRVGAALLQALGYFIGDDLNQALDNLWFTLLFKRRDVLLEPPDSIEALVALFWSRMSGGMGLSEDSKMTISALAEDDRIHHGKAWLQARADTFLALGDEGGVDRPWGWKEPNTHFVIEQLFALKPTLRYIHFTRHPLAMALSSNQNQLEFWGQIVLDCAVERTPRWSLALWCSMHKRIERIMRRYPQRFFLMDFDRLCAAPNAVASGIAEFLGIEDAGAVRDVLLGLVDPQRPGGHRCADIDLNQFDLRDIEYIQKIGYDLDELTHQGTL
jgi:hypothetical protein